MAGDKNTDSWTEGTLNRVICSVGVVVRLVVVVVVGSVVQVVVVPNKFLEALVRRERAKKQAEALRQADSRPPRWQFFWMTLME